MREIYVSTDVETDGPIPGPHSMLSLGSAAYTADKRLLSTFSANLETLEGAAAHPETAAWWATQPEAWAACRSDLEAPDAVMKRYFSALDMKSFAMAVLRKDYRASTKANMPRQWFDDLPHTHVAVDDAIEQGALFCNMLSDNRRGLAYPTDAQADGGQA
jgi:hypothetical protein